MRSDALAGIIPGHALEIGNERVLAVCDQWIVLRVGGADVPLDGEGWLPNRFRTMDPALRTLHLSMPVRAPRLRSVVPEP